ncbi:hypothetical protein CBR_g41350 [Chara braunii]|uniref:Reverse transcriptase domain-containing protein n=1 Tax=Chara braunii TaxID=69332 RepID=A0A388LVS2_CHABU|nr:hypothetical protein CBR_g41350 [Chara braunii]|eukprot:GBG86355.1 hypothetical protein CBR_g41350 [Chara braunii]
MTCVNLGVMDAIKDACDTGRFAHFFEMLCFSDFAVLAGAWERSKQDFDDELGVLGEHLELRKQDYARECKEPAGRSARVERILLRIWGVDDSHLDGRIHDAPGGSPPTTVGNRVTRCDDLAIEDDEREETERAIAAIASAIRDSPLADSRANANVSDQDRYTAFAPLASTYWVEHTSTGFRHAIWKMETFNHIAPTSVRALQFMGNISNAQVKECRTQAMKGKLKFFGRVPPLDPQDLKFPPMRVFDLDKCGDTSSGMWQKAIRQQDRLDLRNVRKIWSVGRPYLKCKCKREKNKDCGDTPLWFDHALWYLLAHPDVLFPDMSSIKIRTSMPAEVFCDFDVAQWMEAYDLGQCPCRSRRYMDMRNQASIELLQCEGQMHVITLDSSITDNPLPQGIINAGLNHIPCMSLDIEEAQNEMGVFLDKLMAEVLELWELSTSTQSFLRRVILKRAKTRMIKYKEQHRHVSAEPFEHLVVKREVEFLTRRFLICPTDKAPNTPTFVCKNFIRKLAFQRLTGPEFVSIASSPASVITRIQGELSSLHVLPDAHAALPYLMAVCKAHKGTFRWITNTAGTAVSHADELCACLLRFLLPLVQTFCLERSLEVEARHGVKPNLWWSTASVGEFCANLQEKIYSIFTADITRCFEAIPTDSSEDSLPTAVRFYVQCAMQVQRERSSSHAIQIRRGANGRFLPSWVDAGQAEELGSMIFREQDVFWLSEWCISNSLLRMGDFVWRQVKGIPMGLACSPIWCDVYLFKYEFHAMMRLADTGNAHLIPFFSDAFRYIDDLGAINNTIISSFVRRKEDREENDPCWIYPDEYIEIRENTEVTVDGCGRRANFLCATITITSQESGTYTTSRLDRREGLGFSPCRFMKYKSNRSAKQALQIITAQVAQVLLLCSELDDAAEQINKVVAAMRSNGFAGDACWRVVRKTLRNVHRYQPGRVSVHTVKEALTRMFGFSD